MPKFIVCACCVCCALLAMPALPQTSHPYPPGMIDIEKHPQQLEPPIGPKQQAVTPAQLQKDADKLSKLADSIPADVNNANRGVLSKDVLKKLKEIEKLSKQLRQELTSK